MKAPPTPRPEQFTSRLRSPAVAARVGLWLGVSFGTCFLTGLISHYAQLPSQPVPFPTSPSWGYRVTQGLHVVTGTVAVPLLLVKLWSVYPRLFERLPSRRSRELLVTGLERLSIAVLVSTAVFQLAIGLANATRWYPWSFSFRTVHYATAYVVIGALVVHVTVKLPVIRDVLRGDVDDTTHDRPTATEQGVLSRRGLLRTTWLAAGVAAITTAGQTVPWLRDVSIFASRTGEGPQGVPVNKTAASAEVLETATDPAWRLAVTGPGGSVRLSRGDLVSMTQRTESLPIACVEGWSAGAEWTGVRLSDVLAMVGAEAPSEVVVRSLQESGPYTTTTLPPGFAADDRTLLALRLNGDDLDLDHGYPCRLIAPNRPGVLQTKWLASLEVTA